MLSIRCVRTTISIDDDVLLAVKDRARAEGRTAGEVLSDLARQALTRTVQARATSRSGFPLVGSRGRPVTQSVVDSIRDEETV